MVKAKGERETLLTRAFGPRVTDTDTQPCEQPFQCHRKPEAPARVRVMRFPFRIAFHSPKLSIQASTGLKNRTVILLFFPPPVSVVWSLFPDTYQLFKGPPGRPQPALNPDREALRGS